MKFLTLLLAALNLVFVHTPLRGQSSVPLNPQKSRAVVLVTGGALRTPFTTPTEACEDKEGFLSAGTTYTALRRYLLEKGKHVYTAPAMDDWGPVKEPVASSFGPFTACPPPLPEFMTVMTTGDWNAGGERLARFLTYLNVKYGVTDVDLVGHSNGGLWSRAAIKVLKDTNSPIQVRSLTTISSPHLGATPPRYYAGEITLAACAGNAYCEQSVQAWSELVKIADKGLSAENTVRYTSGPNGWNAAQGNVLSGIPVVLLGGTYFRADTGDSTLWPYDGTVPLHSAWAEAISSDIIPWRSCWEGALVHWIGQSEVLGIGWDMAITNNPAAMERVNQAIDDADKTVKVPNGQGCR